METYQTRGGTTDDKCMAAASYWVLQDTGKFGISVGNMGMSLRKFINNVRQKKQRFVDITRLSHRLSIASLGESLRPRKINKIQ